MTRSLLLLTLALMCENVNAAPQVTSDGAVYGLGREAGIPSGTGSGPVVAAPFTLAHPLCQTGFTIAMRFDERNAAGTITKSVWVRKCTKGKITYGGRV